MKPAKLIPVKDLRDLLKALYEEKLFTLKEVGQILHLSPMAVREYLIKNKIPLRGRRTDHFKARKSRLHEATKDDWERLGIAGVARKFNVTYNRAYNFWHKYKEVLK